MTQSPQQKPLLRTTWWDFTSRHWYSVAAGVLLGAVIAFAAPTLLAVSEKVGRKAVAWTDKHFGRVAIWPKHANVTLIIVFLVLGLFCAIRITGFLKRAWTSWRAGLISALGVAWFLASGIAFTLLSVTGSLLAVLVLTLGVAATVITSQRDLRLGQNSLIGQADPDEPISARDQDILGRDAVVASIVRAVVEDGTPVVALTGAFGDGKTSVLNLLSKALAGRKDVICIRFSTWLPMDEKTLVSTLLGTVLSNLEKTLVISEVKRDLTAFTRLLFAVLPRIPAHLMEWVDDKLLCMSAMRWSCEGLE